MICSTFFLAIVPSNRFFFDKRDDECSIVLSIKVISLKNQRSITIHKYWKAKRTAPIKKLFVKKTFHYLVISGRQIMNKDRAKGKKKDQLVGQC